MPLGVLLVRSRLRTPPMRPPPFQPKPALAQGLDPRIKSSLLSLLLFDYKNLKPRPPAPPPSGGWNYFRMVRCFLRCPGTPRPPSCPNDGLVPAGLALEKSIALPEVVTPLSTKAQSQQAGAHHGRNGPPLRPRLSEPRCALIGPQRPNQLPPRRRHDDENIDVHRYDVR